jgi:hypothetical protein
MNTFEYDETHDLEIRKVLGELLTRLNNEVDSKELVPPINNGHPSVDVDTNVLSTLTYAQSTFTGWIFHDFHQAKRLLKILWTEFSYKAIQCYQKKVHDRKSSAKSAPVALRKSYDRLNKVCKNLIVYYREFIRRTVEQIGVSPRVKELLPHLRLERSHGGIDTTSPEIGDTDHPQDAVPYKDVAPDLEQSLHETLTFVLCRLGDLWRYRAEFDYIHSKVEEKNAATFKYATSYYNSAERVNPQDSAPIAMLGYLAVQQNDYFQSLYLFSKSRSVPNPAEETRGNMRAILKAILSLPDSKLLSAKTACLSATEGSAASGLFMRLAKIYAYHYYPISKGPSSSGGPDSVDQFAVNDSEAGISELLHLLRDQIERHMIPGHALIRLTLVAILQVSQFDVDTQYALRGRREDSTIVDLTISIFETLVHVAHSAVSDNNAEVLRAVLPALRICVHWINIYLLMDDIWEDVKVEYRPLFNGLALLLEDLRIKCGFEFDPWTCAATSVLVLEEERSCLAITALNGGLDDTPSGIVKPHEKGHYDDIDQYRAQCLLFSGVELGRSNRTYLKFDADIGQFSYFDDSKPIDPMESDSDDEVVFLGRRTR